MRTALITATLACVLLGGCASVGDLERRIVFRPVADDWPGYRPEILGQDVLRIPVAGTDEYGTDEYLSAWWVPAGIADAPTVLYLHGARVNLSGSVYRIRGLRDAGYNVFAIDYRGFGHSSPRLPSEDSVYEDAETAWRWLIAREPDARRRVLYGHSLGGTIAADLAARHNGVAALVLESAFTTLREVADRGLTSLLPLDALLTQRFDTREKLSRVRVPVLLLHGVLDELVPVAMARELYAIAPSPKRLLLVEGAGHRWVVSGARSELRQAMAELACLPRC